MNAIVPKFENPRIGRATNSGHPERVRRAYDALLSEALASEVIVRGGTVTRDLPLPEGLRIGPTSA